MGRMLILVAFLVLIFPPAGNAQTSAAVLLLARDDTDRYDRNDLEIYLHLTQHPMADAVAEGLKKSDSFSSSVVEQEISSLAFRRLFVQERSADLGDTAIDAQARAALRDYALQKTAQDLALEARVAPDELKKAYEENKEEYRTAERRTISILYKLFPADEEGRERVIRDLQTLRSQPGLKENFLEEVKRRSDLPNALQGGVVDYFTTGTYGPTVERYAFQTPKGELSPVFWATQGAYILKCLDVKPEGYKPLEEMEKEIRNQLTPKKAARAREALLREVTSGARLWMADPIPPGGPADLPLLRVNDYTLTSGSLFQVHPEIRSIPAEDRLDYLRTRLKAMQEKELLLQRLLTSAREDPHSPAARELAFKQDLTYYTLLFRKLCSQRIQSTEPERRDYYEKNKAFYHAVTPMRLEYLLVLRPDQETITEPEFHRQWNEQYRKAAEFRDRVAENPDKFEWVARGYCAQDNRTQLRTTDWVEKMPPEWKLTKPLVEFSLNRISPVFTVPQGFLVFKVKEVKQARLLSYEEVEDKLDRVVRAGKEGTLSKELKKEILSRHHFEMVYPTAVPGQSPPSGSQGPREIPGLHGGL